MTKQQQLQERIRDTVHELSALFVSDAQEEHLQPSHIAKKKKFVSDFYEAELRVSRRKTLIKVELKDDAIIREQKRFFRWNRCKQEWGFMVNLSKSPISAVKFFYSPDMWEDFTVKTQISDTLVIETPESGVHHLLMCVAFEKVYANSQDWDRNRHFVGKCEFTINVPEKSDFKDIQELKQKLLAIGSECGSFGGKPDEKDFEKDWNELVNHFQFMNETINKSDAGQDKIEDFEELIRRQENVAYEKLARKFGLG